ncbi:thiamine/thiamine pyrophosphate ABC transporter permease ThiP [uncultured Litoreibacter sp.]|uniref:thiamine/thiamine pyrophosphate ABC transporter permease ThiP n=1 Tax=uncultured Litoreibacter sp. TaxID=1392394 RepID=UPI0026054EFA|nr:thiamine/thiamine pyrophosphate ABC transporter permease ThiP [uncultured Litoreibacter sp.]
MAERVQPITLSTLGGAAVVALLVLLTLGTLGAVAWRAEEMSALSKSDWSAVRFTLWQAAVSAVLSALLAIPVARALARRNFWGRSLLLTILGAPFILPVIVAVLGLLAIYGRSGLLSKTLVWAGLEPISIYGWHGVILAHVFFNLPLATRLILQAWLAIPAERFRLAQSLGFSSRDISRHLEWPMLREVLPGVIMIIFLICTTSFAVALALGGGPKATTIELAIYQAFRFDFDLSKAALLGLVQFLTCTVLALLSLKISVPVGQGAGLDRVVQRNDGSLWIDGFVISVVAIFLITPLALIVVKGVPGLVDLPPSILGAAWRSVWVALVSAGLTVVLAVALALLSLKWGRGIEAVGYLTVAASPLVIGTGLFILTYRWIDPVLLALPVTVVVNAAMSLPFTLRALAPTLRQVESDYGRLASSLGLKGWARLRILLLPRLRRPLGFGAGLAAALSMGDLGVITLFADPTRATLPLALYNLMTAYRMDQAFAAALVLLALSLTLFWVLDRGGRVDADV